MSHLPTWIFVLLQLSSLILASPIYAPQFLSVDTGRNIRHLPCVSLRTGETGVCMFAFTCAKANGTHLGTCIDRFYFGSCCKLNDDPEVYPEDNAIEEAPPARPFVTTDSAIESNDIPDYFTRPKPIVDKLPASPSPSSTTEVTLITTQSVRVQASTESHKVVTKRPNLSTPYTTTHQPMDLSTFQTAHNYSQYGSNAITTETTLKVSSSGPSQPEKPSATETPAIVTTSPTVNKPKPSPSSTANNKIPIATETTTKRPTSVHRTKPPVTRKPPTPTTPKAVSSATQRTPPATRFPPRNATTTARPLQASTTTTTRKPGQHSPTKKPSVTTKRPGSATKKPDHTSLRPPFAAATTGKPTTTSVKPSSTNQVKVTQTARPSTTSSQAPTTTVSTRPSSNTAQSSTESRPSQRPITKKPAVTNGSDRVTTSRPFVTSSRPRPSSKPTKAGATASKRPATANTTPRPQQTSTVRTKPLSSSPSSSSSSSSRPSTLRPSPVTSMRPKPTERPTKPTKPTKPSLPTLPPTLPASGPYTTTQPSTISVAPFIYNGSTLTNEILPPKIAVTTDATTEKVTQTTHSPGLVTWSSNSDDDVTKSPEPSSTVSGTTQNEATLPQWSPITTPDGWIMIQSPTTAKPVIGDETAVRPKPTKIPPTSGKPPSESTERVTTPRPTVPTVLSTIATVTTATDLPVPMETLNMSDYKQVCGRRLFPESRIVGGENSTFGKWPWQISLRQWRTKAYLHKCGAALLNENWAITAAHCVENVPPSDLLLRIGEHDLANEDEPYGFQERRVQIVASHPQFDPRTFEYDLALLRFYEPLEPFQPNILPICLPDDDENYVGHSAYVTGWGRLFEDGPLPSVLQEVSVPVINNTVCEGMYRNAGYIEHIPHIFICAGWRKGGFDSCEGDSGGPMVIRRPRDKRWILAGVISWGIGCAEPNQPGVYTRISEFREWINQILQF